MEADTVTPPTWADRAARGVFCVLLFAAIFTYPSQPQAELDASWRMVLTTALDQGWQFGRDIVFTYGPLGFLMGNTYSGVAFWPFVLWQAVSSLVFTVIIYRQGLRLQGYGRAFYWGLTILVGVGYVDALHMVIIALVGAELIRDAGQPRRWWGLGLLVLLGFLASIKFTNLMLAGFVVLIIAGLEFWQKRPRAALTALGVFALTYLIVWLGCRQSLSALPAYLINSLEISRGYEQTMGIATPAAPFWKGIVVFVLIVIYTLLHYLGSKDRARAAAGCLMIGAFTYLNWKHGFVRSDGHMIGFFICALVPVTAFPALLAEPVRMIRWQRAVLVPAGILALWGIHDALPGVVRHALAQFQERICANASLTFNFGQTYTNYRNVLRMERVNLDLPKTRETVGQASVDVFGHQQAVALYNRLNYRPRPVIQSYSAYTPRLARLNADYYASDRAPEYVLFRIDTIDERFPTLDDSLVLYQLAHRYRFVHSEKGFLLWRRLPSPADPAKWAPAPLHAATLEVGAPLSLKDWNDRPLWIRIDLPRSPLGVLRDFFYKPPFVRLHIRDREGNTTAYRMPLPLARSGFIINPMIEDTVGYMNFSGGNPGRVAEAIGISIDPADRKFFARNAEVEVSAIKPSMNGSDYFLEAEKLRFHMFKSLPLTYEAQMPISEDRLGSTPVMVLHARSEMVFNVHEGSRRVQGAFGYLPGAYTKGGQTDGAEFSVTWSNGAERVELLRRFLDPVKDKRDQGLQTFDLELPPQSGGRLFFRIHPGPKGNFSWDWTFWTGIGIE